MSLTICTVVYNEEKNVANITQNIACLLAYWPTAHILIVDNASTDDTLKQLQKNSVAQQIVFLQRSKNHLGEARQQAVEFCHTKWLCFLDADCTLSPQWIENAQRILATLPSSIAGVGGAWRPSGSWALTYESLFATLLGHGGMAYLKKPAVPLMVFHLPTALLIYRTESLRRAGGFSREAQKVGEDLQMSHQICKAGETLLLEPALSFQHILPSEYFLWWKKMWRYGTARGKMAWLYPKVWLQSGLWSWIFLVVFVLGFVIAPTLTLSLFFFYLFACASICWWMSSQNWERVFLLMLGTHWFYVAGMFWGFLTAIAKTGLAWRRFGLHLHKA